ncbi:MAG TPA: hypothetical protein PKJ41_01385 [Bryobacteraceae bacterium]|nr:hypothetical protein [Bryobacteraceae bacterium]HPT25270.1 hypothetical protein [Bryobacteraceae bacterium]
MDIPGKRAALTAAALLLAAVPLLGQGGYGGIGGFGGIFSGAGLGPVRPDVPSIRPWLGINGNAASSTYEDETTPVRYGASVSGGVSISRAWERTRLVGSYSFVTPIVNTYRYNGMSSGTSHVGGIQLTHRLTQNLTFNLSGMGGSANGGYGYGGGMGGFAGVGPVGISTASSSSQSQTSASSAIIGVQNMADNGLVDNELFGTRVTFSSVQAGLSYSASQRDIFTLSAGASRVRRALDYLVGSNSAGFGGGYTRVLTSRTNTGVHYGFNQFEYPGYYGGNQLHSLAWSLGSSLTPSVSFNISAGAFLYRVNNIGTVTLPSEMAALLGTSTVQQVNDVRYKGFSGGAALSKIFRVGSGSISYYRGARPGSGYLFATQQETGTGSYSVGWSRFSLGTSAVYSRGKSISSLTGKVQNKAVIAFGSFRLLGSLHATGSASHHWINAGAGPQHRTMAASAGIAFGPGSYPLWF